MTVKITTHEKKGTVTLSGLSFDDLRSLITAASLYRYEEDKKATDRPEVGDYAEIIAEIIADNNLMDRMWRTRQRQNIKLVEMAMQRHYWKPGPPTKADRLKAVREEIAFRKNFEAYIREHFNKRGTHGR